ncbi:MAG: hypothetical protein EOM13_07180, partial [Clostridia bacterium]|nr:hypothetical protein [Clostridia bacterium]
RLSTIRQADRILLIRDGKVVEDGNHRQLMHQRGEYYRLYSNQFISDSWLQAESEGRTELP